jgi:hypothetical protein
MKSYCLPALSPNASHTYELLCGITVKLVGIMA